MKLVSRLKALLLRQTPMSEDEILLCYMEAARQMKPTPMFARDFARLIEARHGIHGSYKVPAYDPLHGTES